MSDWTGIKKSINSTLGTPDDKPLNEIIDSEIANLNKSLSTLLKSGNIPIVKSVQRGVHTSQSNNVSISINNVDVDKSIILLETRGSNGRNGSDSTAPAIGAYITNFSSTLIKITKSGWEYSTGGSHYNTWVDISWQVIEFY